MIARRALSLGYLEAHPDQAAALLEHLPTGEVASCLGSVPPAVAADVIARMAPLAACACLVDMLSSTGTAVLETMSVDIASALLRRMPTEVAERLTRSLSETRADRIRGLLRFAERTAGALVDPMVLALPSDVSAAAALEWVRTASPAQVDHELFVIDRAHTLDGVVSLRALIAAPGETRLEALVEPVASRLAATAGLQAVLASPVWVHTRTAPVVDERGVFLGVLRYDTARREADPAVAVPSSTAVIRTLVSLSELYWSGCGRLTTELVTAMTGSPRARPNGGAHASDR